MLHLANTLLDNEKQRSPRNQAHSGEFRAWKPTFRAEQIDPAKQIELHRKMDFEEKEAKPEPKQPSLAVKTILYGTVLLLTCSAPHSHNLSGTTAAMLLTVVVTAPFLIGNEIHADYLAITSLTLTHG